MCIRDRYGTDKWREYEKEFAEAGVRIVYFPYTRGVSSTQVSKALAAVDVYKRQGDHHLRKVRQRDAQNA